MRFRNMQNLGENRWFMMGWTEDTAEDKAFKDWMEQNCSECMCVYRFNNGDPYWEVRGGDLRLQTLILLRWTK